MRVSRGSLSYTPVNIDNRVWKAADKTRASLTPARAAMMAKPMANSLSERGRRLFLSRYIRDWDRLALRRPAQVVPMILVFAG